MEDLPKELVIGLITAAVVGIVTLLWKKGRMASLTVLRGIPVAARLRSLGLTQIYGNRSDYAKYRKAARLIDYLSLANNRVYVLGYWLAQGSEMEGVIDGLERLMKTKPNLHVSIMVMDPAAEYTSSVALSMGQSRQSVVERVNETLRGLSELEARLGPSDAQRLSAALHVSQPNVSLIAIDPESPNGRIQVDVKPFGIPRSRSISFECQGAELPVYSTLWESCQKLVKHGKVVDLPALRIRNSHPNPANIANDVRHD